MKAIVKTPEQIEGIRDACEWTQTILGELVCYTSQDISTKSIENQLVRLLNEYNNPPYNNKIESASLNYKGFPGYCCISINDEMCHSIPVESKIIKQGDLVKIDLALKVNGYYGDVCRCFVVGYTEDLLPYRLAEVAKHATKIACMSVRPGKKTGDIGYIIQTIVRSCGFEVIPNFTGHGVGLQFHEEFPIIYPFGEKNRGEILEPGMIFTIEPIITAGKTNWYVDKDNWTVKTKDGSLTAQHEETILVTETGYEILT